MRHAAILLMSAAALALTPLDAGAQVLCLPPEEPYPYEPPRDDPELRDLVNEQYEEYVFGIEDYINCLEAERQRAIHDSREIVQRWVQYFGDDAALRYGQTPEDMPPPAPAEPLE